MEKKHNGAIRHAYVLPLLQIPMFQNYLMVNVSCVRNEGSNATTKRDSQLQVTITIDEAVESFLAAAKAKDPSIYQELLLLDL